MPKAPSTGIASIFHRQWIKKKVIDRRAVAVKEKEGKKRPKTRPCYSNSRSNTILRMRYPFIEKVIP